MKLVLVLLFACVLTVANASKILGIFPLPGKSHYVIGEATMRALNDAGHEITMISVFNLTNPRDNYRDVHVDAVEVEAEGQSEL